MRRICACIVVSAKACPTLNYNTRMGFSFAFVNDPYGPRWRRMRRAMHPHVSPATLPSYSAIQLRGVHNLLGQLLSDPEHFRQHSRAYVIIFLAHVGSSLRLVQIVRQNRL
jgi:cytochrome P450